MERWSGRVAVVTGASSGIGAAITKDLLKSGMIVVGLARRKERIQSLLQELELDQSTAIQPLIGKLHAIECDITNDNNIIDAFAWIEQNLGRCDVLINNAGIVRNTSITEEGNEEQLKQTIQTNLWGTILCTKKMVEIMKRCNINDGHIINVNSIVGHKIMEASRERPPVINVYPATKFAITAITEVLRQEFHCNETQIKVSSISPGLVATDIAGDDFQDPLKNMNVLYPNDVSKAMLYILGTPPHVQIHELIIKPLGEIF